MPTALLQHIYIMQPYPRTTNEWMTMAALWTIQIKNFLRWKKKLSIKYFNLDLALMSLYAEFNHDNLMNK